VTSSSPGGLHIKSAIPASGLGLDSAVKGSPEGKKKPRRTREWIAMLAFLEGHPNTDVMIFYLVASTVFALLLYRYHRKQV
jgi:hypothetical protein